MSGLEQRIIRLEARRRATSASAEGAANFARYERWRDDLIAFVRAAFPDSRNCIAHDVAQILGLPDSPAFRAFLQRQPLVEIARARYGIAWQTKMEATAAAAGVNCQAVHGVDWAAKFVALWAGSGSSE
jgi:hypothetical protein